MTLIDIHDATIWRGSTCVFENLTLRIEQHERVAILGPNGCGKTTLLKTINRELYPVARDGSWVRILGRDDWNVSDLREHIGIVSEDLQTRYTPTTTALEVVVSGFFSSIGVHGNLAGSVTAEHVARSRQALAELGMAEFCRTPLCEMSTGQQRRCLLARALVHKPDTLILDEPTAGLDFAASFDYLRRVQRLATQGKNIVIATHHLNEIPHEVDRVVLLRAGRVLADGDKNAVLSSDNLSHAYSVPIKVVQIDGYFHAHPG
jgi:iron complex transport system ATP-binding protein